MSGGILLFIAIGQELFDNLSRSDDLLVYKKGGKELKGYHYSKNRRISPIIVSTHLQKDGVPAKLISKDRTYNKTESKTSLSLSL